jgi:hypothetical protein
VSSNNAQLRAISPSIIAQLFAALHGGCVAGETSRQIATRFAADSAPISAAHDSVRGGAVDDRATLVGVDDGAARSTVAACGVGPHALVAAAAATSQVLIGCVFMPAS